MVMKYHEMLVDSLGESILHLRIYIKTYKKPNLNMKSYDKFDG